LKARAIIDVVREAKIEADNDTRPELRASRSRSSDSSDSSPMVAKIFDPLLSRKMPNDAAARSRSAAPALLNDEEASKQRWWRPSNLAIVMRLLLHDVIDTAHEGHSMPSMLSRKEVARYHEDGYIFVRGLFDADETDLLRRAMEEDPAIRDHSLLRADQEGGATRISLWNRAGDSVYGLAANRN
jgi:hypothetical protein